MKTVRVILSQLRTLLEYVGDRRRDRVERKPVVEPMEPRTLLSGMEPSAATLVPPHHSGAELVIAIHQPSSFHVLYQPIHTGELSAPVGHASAATASTVEQTSAQTMNMTPDDDADDDSSDDNSDDTDDDSDDDSGDDSGDDGGDDSDDGSDDNGDEIDIENDGDEDP
jgi:hypothetical protein